MSRGLPSTLGLLTPLGLSDDQVQSRGLDNASVLVLGDSIGVGIAGAFKRAGVPVRGMAENGTTARQWRARVTSIYARERFVVVSLGTNDAQSAELRREFASNVLAIAAELQARGHVVCLVLPPSEKSAVPSSADWERLTTNERLIVIQERVHMSDAWHPTAAGYDRLVAVLQTIRRTHQ